MYKGEMCVLMSISRRSQNQKFQNAPEPYLSVGFTSQYKQMNAETKTNLLIKKNEWKKYEQINKLTMVLSHSFISIYTATRRPTSAAQSLNVRGPKPQIL